MTADRRVLCAALAGVVAAAAACAKAKPLPPPPPPADLVVLVPDAEDARVGSATVTTPQGAVELVTGNHATRIVSGQAPSTPAPIPDEEIQRRFGDASAARPLPPREFLLYFEAGGDTLTPDSQARVAEILEFVRQRPAPDVSVIGHTDTTGEPGTNVELGRRRAALIRDLLVKGGLDPARVEIASHGETDLLVPTPDYTNEPRNRRVEVTVR